MAYGTKTANIMDIPLSISSVVAPHLGDNGYKMVDVNSIRVLSIANGSLADYDEGSATAPFGAASLVVPAEQVLTLAYNKSMLLRIQKTQIQDQPIGDFSKKVGMQQADQVFVPAHDAYSLGKILAARPVGNKVVFDAIAGTNDLKLQFSRTIDKVKTGGGSLGNIIAWVGYDIASQIRALINYTGSSEGYSDGKNGYIGKLAGAKVVETPDAYLGAGVYSIVTDKKAIINVTPKMDPKGDGFVVLDKVPGFSGIEIQMRDRGDTFALSKKVNAIASLEND
jgi:hypothetical protein